MIRGAAKDFMSWTPVDGDTRNAWDLVCDGCDVQAPLPYRAESSPAALPPGWLDLGDLLDWDTHACSPECEAVIRLRGDGRFPPPTRLPGRGEPVSG